MDHLVLVIVCRYFNISTCYCMSSVFFIVLIFVCNFLSCCCLGEVSLEIDVSDLSGTYQGKHGLNKFNKRKGHSSFSSEPNNYSSIRRDSFLVLEKKIFNDKCTWEWKCECLEWQLKAAEERTDVKSRSDDLIGWWRSWLITIGQLEEWTPRGSRLEEAVGVGEGELWMNEHRKVFLIEFTLSFILPNLWNIKSS